MKNFFKLSYRVKVTLLLLFIFLLHLNSCGRVPLRRDEQFPLKYRERGIASWYGHDFHGRKTANGEVYDMYKCSAAHKYLPLGCQIRVTNLENQKSIVIKVNDRGPFINGRILDLSYGAARELDMVEDGLARVELEIVQLPQEQRIDNFFIQVGAFSLYENAMKMHQKLITHDQVRLVEYKEPGSQIIYRVWLGPYNNFYSTQKRLNEVKKQGLLDSFIVAETE